MYEYITSHGKLNQYHLKKIEQTIDKALSEHPRVLAVRIDLHTPVLKPLNDMPDEANFARTDSSVISRFTDSLKAKISHHLNKREKRVNAFVKHHYALSGPESLYLIHIRNIITYYCYSTGTLSIHWERTIVKKVHSSALYVSHGWVLSVSYIPPIKS